MNELSLFNDFFDDLLGNGYGVPAYNKKSYFHEPKVDVKESKDNYILQMDLPGKTDKDVNIELDHNTLTISSIKEEKKEEKSDKKSDEKWIVRERSYSHFSRRFALPDDVAADNISASVKNGVLTVTMPRKALTEPKRIAITAN